MRSHAILLRSHAILLHSHAILLCSHAIYCIPTQYYCVPTQYYCIPSQSIAFPRNNIVWPRNNIVWPRNRLHGNAIILCGHVIKIARPQLNQMYITLFCHVHSRRRITYAIVAASRFGSASESRFPYHVIRCDSVTSTSMGVFRRSARHSCLRPGNTIFDQRDWPVFIPGDKILIDFIPGDW